MDLNSILTMSITIICILSLLYNIYMIVIKKQTRDLKKELTKVRLKVLELSDTLDIDLNKNGINDIKEGMSSIDKMLDGFGIVLYDKEVKGNLGKIKEAKDE